ncbi:MAG: DivIVA domain-containing protein, partial [Streptosporangiaceae bacterium]
QRATKASAQAEQTRRDADQHSRQLVTNAKKNADQIVAQAKSQAEQLLADTKSEADRVRTQAQRHVDDLNRQKDSVTAHLAQISQLLGTQMPGLADALKQPAPAVAASSTKAVTAGPVNGGSLGAHQAPAPRSEAPAPAGSQGGARQPASAKSGKGEDDEWWTQ